MTKKQVLKHTVSYEEGLIKLSKTPKKLGFIWKSHWMSVKQAVRLMGCYWPCAMSPKHKGGVGALAERAGLNREHLYRVLSSRSKPKLDNLMAIISALGFRLRLDCIKL